MSARRRILHISDIHFGPKHLPEVSEGIAALVEEERPDLVVLSGDLTLRAKPAQFRQARAFVDRLRVTAPVLAVPGNHDVPLWRVWERLLSPFGAYRRWFQADLEPVFEDAALFVAGVNTAQAFALKGGRIRRRRMRAIEKALAPVPSDRFRIVVAHHHLAKPAGVPCEHASWGGAAAVARLARAGVDLVLSGHLHQTLELHPAGPDGFVVLHTGTSSSSRGRGPERGKNSLQWIEIGESGWELRALLWNGTSGRFEPFLERSYRRSRGR